MCEGHHGGGDPQSCSCGCGGHRHHGCGCGGHQRHGSGEVSECCCGGHSQRDCGCGHPFRFHRWFSTSEEEVTALEQYLNDLESEAKGVRERLEGLRQTK
jgi:hypothetical protein